MKRGGAVEWSRVGAEQHSAIGALLSVWQRVDLLGKGDLRWPCHAIQIHLE